MPRSWLQWSVAMLIRSHLTGVNSDWLTVSGRSVEREATEVCHEIKRLYSTQLSSQASRGLLGRSRVF